MASKPLLRGPLQALRGPLLALCGMLLVGVGGAPTHASDHADTLLLRQVGRHDARITDLYAFTRGDRLVLALCTDPAIPPDVEQYRFPSDLTLRILLDNDSPVTFDNPSDLEQFGGTLVEPGRVARDVEFRITFDRQGQPKLHVSGLAGSARRKIRLFAGLRDDPFMRTPRTGRNVAAVVLELPLADVLWKDQTALLIWATSSVPELEGPIADHVGRALRSQFPNDNIINHLRPRDHWKALGIIPDVMIYDVSRPVAFPNGRELNDDVVDLVVPPVNLPGEDPDNDQNDTPFLEDFPYLAPPQVAD